MSNVSLKVLFFLSDFLVFHLIIKKTDSMPAFPGQLVMAGQGHCAFPRGSLVFA